MDQKKQPRLIIVSLIVILLFSSTSITVIASNVDLRQNGPITISGNLYEGESVYLTIPVKNYGSSTSPAMHVYTEGYTANGELWRADGASPTAVRLGPGQTINITVQHDLWEGHTGWLNTNDGVYIWNDDTSSYYGPLSANGYNQNVYFYVKEGLDIRQNGEISVSGNLFEGETVYLTIPVKNYGTTTTPAMHVYTEGYTANGELWRADGASPTAVQLSPGETVNITVQHDLWEGHTGWWDTSIGVFIWNDETDNYFKPLNANGYNQNVYFYVREMLDIRQNGEISVSGNLFEGETVYLTIPVKNYGTTTTPAMHVYTEGYTANGELWRADGASPTAVQLSPGETVNITVQHDLWEGHTGWWDTSIGVFIWNDETDNYFGPLNANGHNQNVSFFVEASGGDLRLDGDIEIVGDLFEGEKVYVQIPIRNYGNATSISFHPYTEGFTANDALWRADGAQPTAVTLEPGERITFQVEHDLWYEHTGFWDIYGVYLWNDEQNDYYKPLNNNDYQDTTEFYVSRESLRSLDIEYLDNSNKVIDIDYEIINTLADGSILVDLTIRNRSKLPYIWKTDYYGDIEDPADSIEKLYQTGAVPILPKTTTTIEAVRFTHDSYLQFSYAKFGYDNDDAEIIYAIYAVNLLSTVVIGVYPTGDDIFQTTHDLITGELSLFAEALKIPGLDWLLLGESIGRGDVQDILDNILSIASHFPDKLSILSGHILKTPLSSTLIKRLPYLSLLWDIPSFYWDLAVFPHYAEVKISPSPRPSDANLNNISNVRGSTHSVIAVSSEQNVLWDPSHLFDNNLETGWSTGGEVASGEWLIFRTENGVPLLIEEISIHPGPLPGEHIGATLKDFRIEISIDGVNFVNVLNGTFNSNEIGSIKTFSIDPTIGEYIRIIVDSNQSDNAVYYSQIADITLHGVPYYSADEFEPDSTLEIGTLANPNVIQHDHNFHFPGDVDWYQVQVNQYPEMLFFLETEAPMIMEIYNSEGSILLLQETIESSSRIWWIAPSIEENYYVLLHPVNSQIYGPNTEYSFKMLGVQSKIFFPIICN